MVAYSFQPRFIEPICAGTKRQTLRALGCRRHAHPGDALQIYTGMRTKACRLIGTARCDRFCAVQLQFSTRRVFLSAVTIENGRPPHILLIGKPERLGDPEAFAHDDGFASYEDMARFWHDTHGVTRWDGLLIGWSDFKATEAA